MEPDFHDRGSLVLFIGSRTRPWHAQLHGKRARKRPGSFVRVRATRHALAYAHDSCFLLSRGPTRDEHADERDGAALLCDGADDGVRRAHTVARRCRALITSGAAVGSRRASSALRPCGRWAASVDGWRLSCAPPSWPDRVRHSASVRPSSWRGDPVPRSPSAGQRVRCGASRRSFRAGRNSRARLSEATSRPPVLSLIHI